MKKILVPAALVYLAIFSAVKSIAQGTPATGSKVNTVQPKIMVIPFTKEGEDIRTVLEKDFNGRIAISKVKEGFDNRGFTTVDFTAKLKSAIDDKLFTSENKTDFKTSLIEMSGADIYVEVEVPEMPAGTSGGNVARLIMQAFDASTGNSLSNKTCESNRMMTSDYAGLVASALNKSNLGTKTSSCLEEFLNTMQIKFTDIVENGRSVKVDFSLGQNSKVNFATEIKPDGLPLSDVLDTWMGENSVKNNYHMQGNSDVKVFFDDVRIPLKDEKGNNYNPNKFALKIYQFLKSKGLSPAKQIKNGTIYITIN